MSWKYFLQIETKEMLRKDSKVVVVKGEGAICFFLQGIVPWEGQKLLSRDIHESLEKSDFHTDLLSML